MLLPSVFGNDFLEDLMNFPTWERPTRDAHRELRRMEHEFNGIGGLMRTDVKEDKTGYEVGIDLPGFKKEDVHEIGYHCGTYGQDAGLFQSRKTGKFYVILKRNTTLLANVI